MIWAVIASALLAQEVVPEVRVTSEFVAKGPGREILSPALLRNGWSTFHLTVAAPSGTPYRLYIGQNPEDAAGVAMYRDDAKLELPVDSTIPAGETAEVYRLELWVERDAPVRRMKVEPQLWVDNRWVIYPMEVRVVETQVPVKVSGSSSLDYLPALRAHWCGGAKAATPRNLAQDFAVASSTRLKDDVHQHFAAALGAPIESWCQDSKLTPRNPEWYLKFRDWLLK